MNLKESIVKFKLTNVAEQAIDDMTINCWLFENIS